MTPEDIRLRGQTVKIYIDANGMMTERMKREIKRIKAKKK